MELHVSLRIAEPSASRTADGIPVYPMGADLLLGVEVTNSGSAPLTLDHPETSRSTELHKLATETGSENVFLLNQGNHDVTGEYTAPPYRETKLAASEAVSFTVSLHEYALEDTLEPGHYRFQVACAEQRSNTIEFFVEYQADSVPKLMPWALETAGPVWAHEQAVLYLSRLPEAPEITPRNRRESDEEKAARLAQNRAKADEFLARWEETRKAEDTRAFFENEQVSPQRN